MKKQKKWHKDRRWKWSKKDFVVRRCTQRMVRRWLRKSKHAGQLAEEPVHQTVSSVKALCSSTGRIVWPEIRKKERTTNDWKQKRPRGIIPCQSIDRTIGWEDCWSLEAWPWCDSVVVYAGTIRCEKMKTWWIIQCCLQKKCRRLHASDDPAEKETCIRPSDSWKKLTASSIIVYVCYLR